MLTPLGIRRSASRYSGKVVQSIRMPACIASSEICSVRVMLSIERSRSDDLSGANPNPQFPITTVVTPCQLPLVHQGSQ